MHSRAGRMWRVNEKKRKSARRPSSCYSQPPLISWQSGHPRPDFQHYGLRALRVISGNCHAPNRTDRGRQVILNRPRFSDSCGRKLPVLEDPGTGREGPRVTHAPIMTASHSSHHHGHGVRCAFLGLVSNTTRRAITMKSSTPAYLLLALAVALPLAVTSLAWAGGAALDEDEEDDSLAGVSFFGFAKDSTAAAAFPTPRSPPRSRTAMQAS